MVENIKEYEDTRLENSFFVCLHSDVVRSMPFGAALYFAHYLMQTVCPCANFCLKLYIENKE